MAEEANPQSLKAVKSSSNISAAIEESGCHEEEQVLGGESVRMDDIEKHPVDGTCGGGKDGGEDAVN